MSIKTVHEITVKLLCDKNKFIQLLKAKGFIIVDNYSLQDIFMVPNNIDIMTMSSREILSKAVLLRTIDSEFKKNIDNRITFKIKKFDPNGDIVNQKIIDCDIFHINDAIDLFEAIGYKTIMSIAEKDIIYGKDGLELAIKDIQNGDTLMEIEVVSENPDIESLTC